MTTPVSTSTSNTSSSSPVTQISGLISGLDTKSIIDQLMTLEAQPQTDLKNQVTNTQTTISAYQSLNAQVTALGTLADSLRTTAAWQQTAATSSDSTVSASTSTGATPGSLTFDVTAVASGQTQVSSVAYGGMSANVATGPLSITTAKGTTTITPSDGSLSSVIQAINDSSASTGVRATAIQVGGGSYRLQLSSTTTGAATAFTATGLNDPLSTQSTAHDAVLTFGANTPGAYTVTSATNTISGIMPGLTLTVTKPTTGVTVGVTKDPSSLTTTVTNLVAAANNVLSTIAAATAYDASTKTAGPLLGDSAVRQLQQSVLSTISGGVGGQSLSSVGISLNLDGTIAFDSGAFSSAVSADPDKVQKMFSASGSWAGNSTTTGSVDFLTAGARTPQGPHTVQITQAATRSTATLSGAITAGQVITLGSGTLTASYTTTGTETADSLAAALTSAAASAGIAVGVSNSSGTLQLASADFGSATAFTLSATGGLSASAVTAGLDVQGTIDGVAGTGTGQILAADVSGANNGLSLRVSMSAADLAGGPVDGSLTYTPGFAQKLSSLVNLTTNSVDGSLTTAIAGRQSSITDMQTRISNWDITLAARRSTLETQYAALEVALGNLKSQSTWLAGQIAGLSANSSSGG